MDGIFLAGLLGGVGGLTRGVVGLLKALSLKRRIIWMIFVWLLLRQEDWGIRVS